MDKAAAKLSSGYTTYVEKARLTGKHSCILRIGATTYVAIVSVDTISIFIISNTFVFPLLVGKSCYTKLGRGGVGRGGMLLGEGLNCRIPA